SKCVFGCEGKLTVFSFPKNPALGTVDGVCFSGAKMEMCKTVCSLHFDNDCFINKAQIDGFADRLMLKDRAVAMIKVRGRRW
ncbi:hypothetical protein PO909_024843, partial [Leuciscus waleckii]